MAIWWSEKRQRYQVKVRDAGTGRQRSRFFRTKREAQLAEAELRLYKSEPDRVAFDSFVEDWKRTTLPRLKRHTKVDYATTCKQLVTYFGSRPIGTISAKDVDEFIARQLKPDDRYAPNSVRKQVVRLRQILNDAARWKMLERSPIEGRMKLPAAPKRRLVPLSPAQSQALVGAAPDYYRPLFLTALTTGMRQGELLGLTWDDVDLEAAKLTVRHSMYDGKLDSAKSDAGHRVIDLPKATVEAMRAHHDVCPATPLNLVFPNEYGRPVNTSSFTGIMRTVADTASLPGIHLHDLRHSHVALLIKLGFSPLFIKERLGHSTIAVTMDKYGHLFPNEGKQAAASVDAWLSGHSAVTGAEPAEPERGV